MTKIFQTVKGTYTISISWKENGVLSIQIPLRDWKLQSVLIWPKFLHFWHFANCLILWFKIGPLLLSHCLPPFLTLSPSLIADLILLWARYCSGQYLLGDAVHCGPFLICITFLVTCQLIGIGGDQRCLIQKKSLVSETVPLAGG